MLLTDVGIKLSKRYLIISLILHCLLLVGAMKATPPKKNGSGGTSEIEVSVGGDGGKGEGPGDGKTIIPKEDGEGTSTECEEWYGGIGIIQDFESEITYVAHGYPADKAGIRLGDVIVEQNDEIRGDPGTKLTLNILRNKKKLVFNLVREKICTYKEGR